MDEVNVGYVTAGAHDTSDIGPLNLELSVCDSANPKRGASRNHKTSKNRTMVNKTPTRKFPRNTSNSLSRDERSYSPR